MGHSLAPLPLETLFGVLEATRFVVGVGWYRKVSGCGAEGLALLGLGPEKFEQCVGGVYYDSSNYWFPSKDSNNEALGPEYH